MQVEQGICLNGGSKPAHTAFQNEAAFMRENTSSRFSNPYANTLQSHVQSKVYKDNYVDSW